MTAFIPRSGFSNLLQSLSQLLNIFQVRVFSSPPEGFVNGASEAYSRVMVELKLGCRTPPSDLYYNKYARSLSQYYDLIRL